jgi:hypothetical protein
LLCHATPPTARNRNRGVFPPQAKPIALVRSPAASVGDLILVIDFGGKDAVDDFSV